MRHDTRPHRPLLLLLYLGRAQRGEERLAPYEEVRDDLVKLLNLCCEKGGHKPHYPFYYMKSCPIWDLEENDIEGTPSESEVRGLRGGFSRFDYFEVKEEPKVLREATEFLLRTLPTEHHEEILALARLSHPKQGGSPPLDACGGEGASSSDERLKPSTDSSLGRELDAALEECLSREVEEVQDEQIARVVQAVSNYLVALVHAKGESARAVVEGRMGATGRVVPIREIGEITGLPSKEVKNVIRHASKLFRASVESQTLDDIRETCVVMYKSSVGPDLRRAMYVIARTGCGFKKIKKYIKRQWEERSTMPESHPRPPTGDLPLSGDQVDQVEEVFRDLLKKAEDHAAEIENLLDSVRDKLKELKAQDLQKPVRDALEIAQALLEEIGANKRRFRGTLDERDRMAIAALQYLIDPWDIIPDFIPDHGLVDDAYVLKKVAGVDRESSRLRAEPDPRDESSDENLVKEAREAIQEFEQAMKNLMDGTA